MKEYINNLLDEFCNDSTIATLKKEIEYREKVNKDVEKRIFEIENWSTRRALAELEEFNSVDDHVIKYSKEQREKLDKIIKHLEFNTNNTDLNINEKEQLQLFMRFLKDKRHEFSGNRLVFSNVAALKNHLICDIKRTYHHDIGKWMARLNRAIAIKNMATILNLRNLDLSSPEVQAEEFATLEHSEQKRKYTNEPYVEHLRRVVALVKSVPHTEEMVVAAWLHDIIEDTDVTLPDIQSRFGPKVASMVDMLTKTTKASDCSRSERHRLEKERMSKMTPEEQTIKLADIIDNARNIREHDSHFADVYLSEKRDQLEMLKAGNPTLLAVAKLILEN